MKIKKDVISFDRYFPFRVDNQFNPAGFNMGGIYHWHDCLEISYVKTGKGKYYIEDKEFEMNPGDIIILNNIEPHYLEVNENMNQQVIIFEPSLIWSDCSGSIDYEYLKPFYDRGFDFNNRLDMNYPFAAEIKDNLTAIASEYFEENEGYQLMIKARLLVVLTYLMRYFRDKGKSAPVNLKKRQCLVRMDEVIKYINENITEDIRLNEAAERVHVSPQYFSSIFKKVTGTNFIDYINNIRVNRVIKLLRESDKKITQIAIECGFNNTTNFNSIFKKFTGKTPSHYRLPVH